MNARKRRMARARRAARTPVTVTVHPTWPELKITGRPCEIVQMCRDLKIDMEPNLRGRPATVTLSWSIGGGLNPFKRQHARAEQIRAWVERARGRAQ